MSQQDAGADAVNRETALRVAMVVRNALEDFHARHLSDERTRELNPLVRNAATTVLHALRRAPSSPGAASFVHFETSLVPKYWEEPELLDDYVASVRTYDPRGG